MNPFATIREVVAEYGIPRISVQRMIAAGHIHASKYESIWIIDRQSLEDYLTACSDPMSDSFDGSQPSNIHFEC